MSGGVGPTGDSILLPSDPAEELLHKSSADSANAHLRRRFLSFHQLNALAAMTVTAASGTVPFSDIAFFVFSLLYVHFLSCAAFPSPPAPQPNPAYSSSPSLLRVYSAACTLLGLLLPLAYMLEGILEGDKKGIAAAAPHFFLLACQVFMEDLICDPRFSLPIHVFVPVLYNARRMFAIADWVRSELRKAEEATEHVSDMRLHAGKALALANMAFWTYNLFGLLLPVYTPKALRTYYTAGGDRKLKE